MIPWTSLLRSPGRTATRWLGAASSSPPLRQWRLPRAPLPWRTYGSAAAIEVESHDTKTVGPGVSATSATSAKGFADAVTQQYTSDSAAGSLNDFTAAAVGAGYGAFLRYVWATRRPDLITDKSLDLSWQRGQSFIERARALYADVGQGTSPQARQLSIEIWELVAKAVGRHYDAFKFFRRIAHLPVICVSTTEWVEAVLEKLDVEEPRPVLDLQALAESFNVDPLFMWTQVSIWFLAYDPATLVRFLASTQDLFEPPLDMMRGALNLVAIYYGHVEHSQPPALTRLFATAVCKLIARQSEQSFASEGLCIWVALLHCGREAALEVTQAIEEGKVRLHYYGWLHVVKALADAGQLERAMTTLNKVKDSGASVDQPPFRWGVVTILRKAISEPEGLRVVLGLVDKLGAMGVELHGMHRDIIIEAAIVAGDARTAFVVYDTLEAAGLLPSRRTLYLLLTACQINLNDSERLNRTIRATIEHADVRSDSFLAGNILFTLALYHDAHHSESAYSTIIDAYLQFYDPSPLLKLHLPWKSTSLEGPADRTVPMQPTVHGMNIMIRAYVQHILRNDGDPSDLWPIYRRWRELAEAGEEPYMSLASAEHTANAFLLGFLSQKHTIPHAAQVLRDMRVAPPTAALERGFVQAAPTVRTWTIMIHNLLRHGKSKLAQKMEDAMRAAGVVPDGIALSVLLHGAAACQDLGRVAGVLEERADADLAWDSWTYSALGRVHDQGRLVRFLRETGTFRDAFDSIVQRKGGERQGLTRPRQDGDDLAGAHRAGENLREVAGHVSAADLSAGPVAGKVSQPTSPNVPVQPLGNPGEAQSLRKDDSGGHIPPDDQSMKAIIESYDASVSDTPLPSPPLVSADLSQHRESLARTEAIMYDGPDDGSVHTSPLPSPPPVSADTRHRESPATTEAIMYDVPDDRPVHPSPLPSPLPVRADLSQRGESRPSVRRPLLLQGGRRYKPLDDDHTAISRRQSNCDDVPDDEPVHPTPLPSALTAEADFVRRLRLSRRRKNRRRRENARRRAILRSLPGRLSSHPLEKEKLSNSDVPDYRATRFLSFRSGAPHDESAHPTALTSGDPTMTVSSPHRGGQGD